MISILQTSIQDKKQRHKYKQSEVERRYYKILKLQAKTTGFLPIKTFPKVRIRNYCLVSGKARSVYSRKFRLSRHQIKKYFRYITDLRNSSW